MSAEAPEDKKQIFQHDLSIVLNKLMFIEIGLRHLDVQEHEEQVKSGINIHLSEVKQSLEKYID